MNKNMMALIGMVIALVFIIIALVGPWYSMSFFGITTEAGLFTEALTGVDRGPWDTTMYIAVVALIFSLIALIGVLGINFKFGEVNMMSKIGGIFGILTFVLALVAPLYFMMSALEGMSEIGFWNEMGGPGYGWYMMILAAVVALIFSLPLFKKQVA